MDIWGKIIIELYREGKLVERREVKNLLRVRGAEALSWYIGGGIGRVTSGDFLPAGNLYFVNRLILAGADKTTIKSWDAQSLTRENDTANMRWVVRQGWVDSSTDAYTVYYLGLMWTGQSATVGVNNITGSPGAWFAVKLDPPISKASTDTISISWEISVPYSEVP